ncbi:hypothetical protein F4810DRAFT_667354 [Camillea tinctor]|nr:hypothetical protein F4810DRAFT_667354 [Camillea tinctor]
MKRVSLVACCSFVRPVRSQFVGSPLTEHTLACCGLSCLGNILKSELLHVAVEISIAISLFPTSYLTLPPLLPALLLSPHGVCATATQ